MSPSIQYTQHDGLAQVTLHYPKRFNAMNRAMWRQLRDVFERIQASPDVRCVLVSGTGAHFCAGGDISEYASFRFEEASLREFHEQDVWGALSAMLACDVPMVAQIAGNCMGAGVELASCCDIRLSAESAQFGAPIAKLGFPMAPREAVLVSQQVGELTARHMLLEAAVFGAPEMLQRGFLSRVAADADLPAVAQASVQRILSLAPQAARLNKQTFRALNRPLALINQAQEAINSEATDEPFATLLAGAYAYARGAEQREGITAFLEKRAPKFSS